MGNTRNVGYPLLFFTHTFHIGCKGEVRTRIQLGCAVGINLLTKSKVRDVIAIDVDDIVHMYGFMVYHT